MTAGFIIEIIYLTYLVKLIESNGLPSRAVQERTPLKGCEQFDALLAKASSADHAHASIREKNAEFHRSRNEKEKEDE